MTRLGQAHEQGDWNSSPTLRHEDAPERIDVVIVNGDPDPNRPDLQHYGAGGTTVKPMLAAVANAVFDATGARIRKVPLRASFAYQAKLSISRLPAQSHPGEIHVLSAVFAAHSLRPL